MSTTRIRKPTLVPIPLLLLSGLGSFMIAAAFVGLFAPELAPPLARPAVAYALLGVGVLLDATATVSLVKSLTRRVG